MAPPRAGPITGASRPGQVTRAMASISWDLMRKYGASVGPLHLDFPNGMTLLIIGIVMTAILVLRPQGLTGGRELSLGLPRRRPKD